MSERVARVERRVGEALDHAVGRGCRVLPVPQHVQRLLRATPALAVIAPFSCNSHLMSYSAGKARLIKIAHMAAALMQHYRSLIGAILRSVLRGALQKEGTDKMKGERGERN